MNEIIQAQLNPGSMGTSNLSDPSPAAANPSDVAEFHAAMGEMAGKGRHVSELHTLFAPVQSTADYIKSRGKALDKALYAASTKNDLAAMSKVPRLISELTIATSAATKVIGKVEQAVEQLTKLQ